jgi:hypothetical protein
MIKILPILALFLVKNANFLAEFSAKIFKKNHNIGPRYTFANAEINFFNQRPSPFIAYVCTLAPMLCVHGRCNFVI